MGEGIVKGQRKRVPRKIHRKSVVIQEGYLYIGLLKIGKDGLLDVLRKGYNRTSAASRQGPLIGVRRRSCNKALSVCISVEHQTGLRFLKSALLSASPLRQLS